MFLSAGCFTFYQLYIKYAFLFKILSVTVLIDNVNRFIDCEYSFESGKKAAVKLLEMFPDTDGVFAANDMVALSAYKIFRSQGIKVPENIQIVGFDDIGFRKHFK